MTPADDSTSPFHRRERHALADLLRQVGPDAPTLCEGWQARHLLAHLVLRERHPAAIGIAVRPLAGWTTGVQERMADQPFSDLVEKFRRGPWGPHRIDAVQSAVNTFEHFVHHEDVRRAAVDWTPRNLAQHDQALLWRHLASRRHLYLRGAPVAVTLIADGYGRDTAGDTSGPDSVTLAGEPAELVLYVHGRNTHSVVEVTGTESALRAWQQHRLKV